MRNAKSDLSQRGRPRSPTSMGTNSRSAGTATESGSRVRARLLVFCTVLPAAMLVAIAPPARAQDKVNADEFSCLIQPKMVLKLGTPVPGLISEVLVDRGTIVKKGDVIARLESGVEETALSLATARAANDATVRSNRVKVEFQRRKEERTKQLRKNENISVSLADEAETAARVAEIELDESLVNLQLAQFEMARAGEVLKQRTIRSPISGIVVSRALGPGEYAFDQAHLVTVSQVDPLNVEVFLPLSQVGRIRPGNIAEVYPEEPVGGRYTATVTIVDHVFDAASGTIGVRLEIPNPNYALPAGLKCQVRFNGVG
jgi:RND family efflux transporter MFP subunit